MTKRTGLLMAATLALIAGAIAIRRDPQPEGPVRKPKGAASCESLVPDSIEEPCRPEPPALKPAESEAAFWQGVGSLLEARPSLGEEGQRRAILEATSRVLGLDRAQAQQFESVTRQSILEIENSWQVREAGWRAVSANVGLHPELREQAERDVQEQYETRKAQALARVEAFLGSGPRPALLRGRLEEWMDAVR